MQFLHMEFLEKTRIGKELSSVPLYALKTFGRTKAKLEGDAISDASQDFDQYGKVEVRMKMKNVGANIWEKMTEEATAND